MKSFFRVFSRGCRYLACVAAVVLAAAVQAGENEPDYYVKWAGLSTARSGPYINTGYAFTKMPRVEAGLASVVCTDSDFFGTDAAVAGCFIVDLAQNGQNYFYRYGKNYNTYAAATPGPASLNTETFTDVVWERSIYYNGVRVGGSTSGEDTDFQSNVKPCCLFKGRALYNGTAKVSYLRMYNGTNRTELVRDFRPGVKDGEVGFYDVVEDRFYKNEGTGSFDCGDRLVETDAVLVDTNWLKFGEPSPAYGPSRGLSAGSSRTFTAPTGVCSYGDYQATCIGWKLYTYSEETGNFATEPYLSGTGTTCDYIHPNPAEYVRLEWVWQADASQAETLKAGEWDDPEIWTSKVVPTEDTRVIVYHDVHCSGDVSAKSIAIQNAVLRFHASTAYSVEQATPDTESGTSFTFDVKENVTLQNGTLILHGGRTVPTITELNLSIGGDLTLSGVSKMGVSAAAYAGADCSLANLYNTATRLTVGGAFVLADTSKLYTVCDQKVGSPVRFDCASFTLGASACVIADERGWNWLEGSADSRRPLTTIERNRYTFAYGPGHDTTRTGGGYGGAGSNDGTVTAPGSGASYGFAYAPFLPGSPSGGDSNYSLDYGKTAGSCRGGGVFWLVTSGLATLNGTISATVPRVGWQAASGGSVWVAAQDFSIGANARIDVSGGDAGSSTPTAAGGGGRVSFAKNVPEADLAALARGERPSGYLYSDEQTLVSVDISGGASTASDPAQPGTATFVTPAAALHFLDFHGSPVLATTVTPKYGSYPVEEGSVQVFSADAYGVDPAHASWRYRCAGYVVSNATEQIGASSAVQGEVTIGSEDVSVTWLWGECEYPAYLGLTGPGRLDLRGETYTVQTNVYLKASESNVLTAVPEEGCEFLYWVGEVSDTERRNPVLTLEASQQRHITAVFRTVGEADSYVWKANASGSFLDSANWEGGRVPGVQDAVVVASGTCRIPEFVEVASLTVSGSGKVVTERLVAADGYDSNVLRVTGSVRLAEAAELQMGMTDGSSTVYDTLDVGGDLLLSGTAKLSVTAGPRTGGFTWETGCGFVRVGGDFRLTDTAIFRPNCDGYWGGSVVTRVSGVFFVASGARVEADGRGMGTYANLGYAEGVGTSGTFGACHFGRGANGGAGQAPGSNAQTYDNDLVPLRPGQQNRETSYAVLCRGGGVIRVVAGSVRIDGIVTANGVASSGGNSSGGTIWLVSEGPVILGSTAVLSAQGAYSEDWPSNGASGGGCVALYSNFTPAQLAWVMAHPNSVLGPYADGDKPPRRIRDQTSEFLASHSSLAEAAAPGSGARASDSCWGSVRVLSGARVGCVMIVY